MGVISCRISVCYFPLPLVPSRRGRGKFTFYETIIYEKSESRCGKSCRPALGLLSVRPSLAIDDEPSLLPLDIVFFQIGELAHPETGVQEGLNGELLFEAFTGIGKPVDFIIA